MYVFIILTLLLLFLIYKYVPGNYWKKVDIPYVPFSFPFGMMRDSTLMKEHVGETLTNIYKKYKDVPYVGIYSYNKPQLLIRDPELVKDILIKDFSSFHKNSVHIQENDMFSKNPFAMFGDSWKTTRSLQIQCFTPAKIKSLVPSMQIIAERFVRYIEENTKEKGALEAKDLSVRFTVENVVNTSYGIEAHSFEPGVSHFMQMSNNIFNPSLAMHMRILCIFFWPTLTKYLDVRIIPKYTEEYFTKLISNMIEYRRKNSIERNDFLGILMDLQKQEKSYGIKDITAHAISLFGDGTETSGNAISFTLYELAKNWDVQEKVRQEIDSVLLKHNGKLSYEAIQEMTYLECVIYESMRLHPAIHTLQKICTNDFTLPSPYKERPNKTITLKAGTVAIIPIYGLHLDENYFPEPERFKPERHSNENKNSIMKGTFLPFGDGPRVCLGQRFAMLQIKVALSIVLSNFELRVNDKTKRPLKPDPKYFMICYEGGLWINFAKRK